MIDAARRTSRVLLSERALASNWSRLTQGLSSNTRVLAMVKANAYGHGDLAFARAVTDLGAVGVGVADLGEALSLREGGYGGTILSMGALTDDKIEAAQDHDIALTLHSSDECAWLLDRASRLSRLLRFHLKVDTGMNRWGIGEAEADDVAARLAGHAMIRIEGLLTHLSESDTDPEFTRSQLDAFGRVIPRVERHWGRLIRHAANTNAILRHPQSHFDWVRPGIGLYGYPTDGKSMGFSPVLEWRARIGQVKKIASGDRVGYNRAFVAHRAMTVGIVGAGYGDGYLRNYAPVGVAYDQQRIPVLGTISMDALAVDLSNHPKARAGDEVVLLGSGAGAPDAFEIAQKTGTIAYEILTNIHERVPRSFAP